ncbi:MAG: O-antigen ligase family protein [Nitrospirae bacterium]|nr:O-antigen ligase family protein [Nitrospirota bacterium]
MRLYKKQKRRELSTLEELLRGKNITVDKLLFWGFCGTFFFIPVATSPAIITGILTLAIWVFSGKFTKDKNRWLKEKWVLPVFLISILPWIGLTYTSDVVKGLDFAKKSYYWLYAFAIASLTFHGYRAKALLNSFLLGLSFTAVAFGAQLIGIIPKPKVSSLGFIGHINASLLFVCGILILSFYFSKANGMKRKGLIAIVMAFFSLTVAFNIGRIGYFTFMLLLPLVAYNLLGQRHILKIVGVSILIIGLFLMSPTVQTRISSVVSDIRAYEQMNPNTPIGLRLHMWKGAVKIFLDNPIIGVGTGGYQSAMKRYENPMLNLDLREFHQPHNSFLYMAASFGIIGLISLLYLFFIVLQNGWRYRDDLIGFSVLSFGLVLFIGSLTDSQILSVQTGMLFALFTGLQMAIKVNDVVSDS